MSWFRWDGEDLLLWLKVQPKASADAFAEAQEDVLRVRITAPPVDGKANAHLRAWLAGQFGVARGKVVIENGDAARKKRVRICKPQTIPAPLTPQVSLR